ncbi:hypothetical protein Aduo_003444 [Ancylostoma duodenale]
MLRYLVFTFVFGQSLSQTLAPFYVKNEELLNMSRLLRQADANKASRGQVSISYQGHTDSRNDVDNAKNHFFTKVNDSFLSKPSFKRFIALTDNFYRETGIQEPRVSVREEQEEINAFLDEILKSGPWQLLYKSLNEKKHPFAKDPVTFRKTMYQLWFWHYSRAKGKTDTSGFEHVFIGEEKRGEVSGLHNWVRFYLLEKNSTEQFDYKGFIVKRGEVMASLKFIWKGALKKSGSLLIGTSPEYDMALYTMCFLSRRGKELCEVELDGCPLSVTSYEMVQNNKLFIGTIYPTAGPSTNTCGRS